MGSPPHALSCRSRSSRGCSKGSLQARAVAKQRWDQEWEKMLKDAAHSLHFVGSPMVGVTQQATAFVFGGWQSPGFRKYKCCLLPIYRTPSLFISFKDKLQEVIFFSCRFYVLDTFTTGQPSKTNRPKSSL